jgi:hypothetical protein
MEDGREKRGYADSRLLETILLETVLHDHLLFLYPLLMTRVGAFGSHD